MNGIQFGPEIYSSQSCDDVPLVSLAPLSDEVFASYTGPDLGLVYAADDIEKESGEVAGIKKWNVKDQKAYGICLSLYEQHPVNGKMSGDPVADAFAICARQNNCVMVIADGVNWGEKSRLAARCALYGSMDYLNRKMFRRNRQPVTTHEVFSLLRASFNEAHKVIMDKEGGLTTLCACLICPVRKSAQYAVCCLNVGDSYGYIFSHNQGIREVTQGSHNVSLVRDIRDAGGALGPVDGKNPELHNMTYGLSFVNHGDIVFLTTDGISDNYDPVVTKLAVARTENTETKSSGVGNQNNGEVKENMNKTDSTSQASTSAAYSGKPDLEPQERHIYAMKEMERIVHEHELITEDECSAQELCSAIVQHVLLLTDTKRKVLENPDLYARRRLSQKEKIRRDSEIVSKMSESPGKLDHASIVAYEVGLMRPDEEKMDCIPLGGPLLSGSDTSSHQSSARSDHSDSNLPSVTSPASSSKKIRPKKLFSKIRNLSVSSSPQSPTSSSPGLLPHSPKRFSFKRSKTKGSDSGATTPTTPSRVEAFGSPPVRVEGFISPPTHIRGFISPPLEGFRYPVDSPILSQDVTSPRSHQLPLPAQHPYRKSIAFESSV